MTTKKVNFTVPRAALEAWRFATPPRSKHLMVYPIIHFELDASTNILHALSTDGHRVIHVWWPASKEDVLPTTINLSAEAVGYFLKKVGRVRIGEDARYFRIKRDGFRFDSNDFPEYSLSEKEVKVAVGISETRTFPLWRQIIPSKTSGRQECSTKFSLNLLYLVDLCKYFKACGTEPLGTVHYTDRKGLSPILIEPAAKVKGVDIEYVQMPLKL